MSNKIPERLSNFRAYLNGTVLAGMVDAELPSLEAMTDTVVGAGIAGEVDSPTQGHFGSTGMTFNWRTITPQAMQLARQEWHHIELRGAQQVNDVATGQLITQAVRVAVRAMPKTVGLGTFAVASTTDSSTEFEVSYLLVEIDGTVELELDKFNFKYMVRGEDMLAKVRDALGW